MEKKDLTFVKRKSRRSPDQLQTPNSKLETPNSQLLTPSLDWSDTKIIRTTHPTPPITLQALPEDLPPSVIPFWKPLMTPDSDTNDQLRYKNFANFFATLFCNPTLKTFLEVLPPSVILFQKPLMTHDLDPDSDSNILQILSSESPDEVLTNSRLLTLNSKLLTPDSQSGLE